MLGGLLALVIVFTPLASLQATELAWLNWPGQESRSVSTKRSPKSRLQEVPPPEAVQDIQKRLDKRHPTLQLISPTDEALITTDQIHLVLQVEDWPLIDLPEIEATDIDGTDFDGTDINASGIDQASQEIGPHVAIQIDDRPPVLVRSLKEGTIHLDVEALQPGSHRFSAWAAYPWGEAVKRPGAAIHWRLHQWDKLTGTQPGRNDPWLVPIAPTAWHRGDPLLLDWLIWNAPLQNLRADDQRWTLRLSLNGQSIRLNQQESIWLKGATDSDQITVQMELLDALGEPITPVFNNRLLYLPTPPGDRPGWLKSRLSDDALAQLSGEPLSRQPETPREAEALGVDDASIPLNDGPNPRNSDQSQLDAPTALDTDGFDPDPFEENASDSDPLKAVPFDGDASKQAAFTEAENDEAENDGAENDGAVAGESDNAIAEEEISSSSSPGHEDLKGVLAPPDPAAERDIAPDHASGTERGPDATTPEMDNDPQAGLSLTPMNEPGSSLGGSEEELSEPS